MWHLRGVRVNIPRVVENMWIEYKAECVAIEIYV